MAEQLLLNWTAASIIEVSFKRFSVFPITTKIFVYHNKRAHSKGVLACLDGYMNLALDQTEEYQNGQLKNKYGDAFIRGNNVLYISTSKIRRNWVDFICNLKLHWNYLENKSNHSMYFYFTVVISFVFYYKTSAYILVNVNWSWDIAIRLRKYFSAKPQEEQMHQTRLNYKPRIPLDVLQFYV